MKLYSPIVSYLSKVVKLGLIAGCIGQAQAGVTESSFNRYIDFNWGECPVQFQTSDGLNKCSLANVPVNWEKPNGKKIDVLVSQHKATSGTPKGQIWLLQGGPGGSGTSFIGAYDNVLKDYVQDFDVYILEHRGVGWSTNLNCPEVDANSYAEASQACFDTMHEAWGDDLFNFNTTNAAKDLDYVISKSKTLDWYPSYVYGVSYGTLWAQRFTQVAPTGAQGIILDSVLPTSDFGLDQWDENFDKIFGHVAAYCDSDEFCQQKFSGNTEAAIRSLSKKIYTGEHCPEIRFNKEQLQELSMTAIQGSYEDVLMPLYYRLSRCSDNDVIAINNVHKFFYGGYDGYVANQVSDLKPEYSPVVFNVIAFNEISDVQKTFDEKVTFCESAVICSSTESHANNEVDKLIWGNKYVDPYIYQNMFHYMPTLVLNGDLDPQTPHFHAALIKGAFSNINQRYVEFPFTPHAALFRTPVKSSLANNCAVDVMSSFIDNIWEQPNTRCLNDLVGMNFDLSNGLSNLLFGTFGNNDEYDGPVRSLSQQEVKFTANKIEAEFNKFVDVVAKYKQ